MISAGVGVKKKQLGGFNHTLKAPTGAKNKSYSPGYRNLGYMANC